jgi:hypothetical protein
MDYYDELGKQIEQASGGILRTQFRVQPGNKPLKYTGLILPADAPFYLPIERNRENATVWVEGTTADEIYSQLAARFNIDYQKAD